MEPGKDSRSRWISQSTGGHGSCGANGSANRLDQADSDGEGDSAADEVSLPIFSPLEVRQSLKRRRARLERSPVLVGERRTGLLRFLDSAKTARARSSLRFP